MRPLLFSMQSNNQVLASVAAMFCSMLQALFRGKNRWLFISLTLSFLLLGVLLTSLTAMYPITMEDIMINQELLPVRDQELLTTAYLSKGLARMQRSHLTILGVAKDVSPQLPHILPQLERLLGYFQSSQAIFVEGDSSDDSLSLLQHWVSLSPSNRSVVQVSAKNIKDTFGIWAGKELPREGRIALARNVGLQEYFNHP
ncbi:hypothetical protein EON65_52080, partial [archaeon]